MSAESEFFQAHRCLLLACGSCQADVKRLVERALCPFCKEGEFVKSPSGPADTFTCGTCGAVVLPGSRR